MKKFLLLLVASVACGPVAMAAEPASYKPRSRWAGVIGIEFSAGGDDLYNDEIQLSQTRLGDGITPLAGVLYRPMEDSMFELQALLGYKVDMIVPVSVGPEVGITRTVFQFLGNYRTSRKWYVGGGLVLHSGPKFEDNWPDAEDVKFDDSVGVMIEGGWNWVGLQCTYMEYKSSAHGSFDASNCGVRFMFRFPRWRPVERSGPG